MKQEIEAFLGDSRGEEDAKLFAEFEPSRAQVAQLTETFRTVEVAVGNQPGNCVAASCLLAAMHRSIHDVPVWVIAGDLFVKETHVYGKSLARADYHSLFGSDQQHVENRDWDGHCWAVCGSLICDAGIRSTARSRFSPPELATFFSTYGSLIPAPLVAEQGKLDSVGLRYLPQYALNDDIIDAVVTNTMRELEGS